MAWGALNPIGGTGLDSAGSSSSNPLCICLALQREVEGRAQVSLRVFALLKGA